MQPGAALPAQAQAPQEVQPGEGALDDPAEPAEARAVVGSASRDDRHSRVRWTNGRQLISGATGAHLCVAARRRDGASSTLLGSAALLRAGWAAASHEPPTTSSRPAIAAAVSVSSSRTAP
jgi:hypothetical protein